MSIDLKIEPLLHPLGKKCDFGAVIDGLDLNNFTDEIVAKLREAIWKHKVVIIKGQHGLEPARNWELLQRLDPEAPSMDLDEFARSFYPKDALVPVINHVQVPNSGLFMFIGKGVQDDARYGKPGLDMGASNFNQYYANPLADEDFEAGRTRFHWWHLDGTFWKYEPPLFTAFRPVRFPADTKLQQVDWADGSGQSITVKPGRTAFVSTEQLYDLLSGEEKKIADHSWVEYMSWPYEWVKGCRGAPNGLGVANEGKEVPDEEIEKLPGTNPEWQKQHPMVWVNPSTGKKSFQVQHNLARRLFIRRSPNDRPKVIGDLAEVRRFLDDIQSRIIRPEYIWVGPEAEQDLILFQNYGLMHTKVDYPLSYGVRTVHQGWIPTSRKPTGPVQIPAEE